MRRRRKDLDFRHHTSFVAPAPGWELSAVSVDDDGEHLCLWSSGGKHLATSSLSDGALPIDGAGSVRYPEIAALPGGALLVADSRVSVDRATGYRSPVSSWTFDASGQLIREGSLGDGIQTVLTTPSGQIWVGYFDEGVFGGGETESHGLVRFGSGLEPEWLFTEAVIDDCYALNVFGETATAYFYSSFDIAQVRGDTSSTWSGAPSGAHGLLITGDRCVLVGGYEGRRDTVTHLRLANGEAEVVGQGRAKGLPDFSRPHKRICRGPEMHAIVGSDWFRASLD